ncbi:MAG: hypothetical protein ACFFEF_02485 [Candidatus Thorarchaeota archaeon]
MSFTFDTNLMAITSDYQLIRAEKAVVSLMPGTIWTYLRQDEAIVGIAFHGPARFAVDAIIETDGGAYGKPITGELVGIQFYLGSISIEEASRAASNEDLIANGYSNAEAFVQAADDKFTAKRMSDGDKIDIRGDGGILLGEDASEKVILVAKHDNCVLTYGKRVFVLNDEKMVSVTKDGVYIGGRDGRTIIIDKDGISGLDELENLGPMIGQAVSSAVRGIGRAARDLHACSDSHQRYRRHGHSRYQAYDDVNTFDWDD